MTAAATESIGPAVVCKLSARPYPGLRPFESQEWPIFFGRERMCDEVSARLLRQRLLVVHGDSGCGKSSLTYAGVLPRLEQETARGGARWLTCAANPGDAPLRNVAQALAALPDGNISEQRVIDIRRLLNFGREGPAALGRLLRRDASDHICLLVDQFEEIFAHAKRSGPNEARLLIDFLIGIQEERPEGVYAILTMRSEFLGACSQFPRFAEAVNSSQYLLPRMEPADLVRAIREPAFLYDGEVNVELAERLIEDAGCSQDQLPLIQHGLMLLYQKHVARDGAQPKAGWKLGLEHYDSGKKRLTELLSGHADEVVSAVEKSWGKADLPFRIIEDLFRALTDINADGQAVRRPQTFGQLVAVTNADEAAVRAIVDAFRAEGISFLRPYLITPDGDEGHTAPKGLELDDRIDISHEALIRCWDRLAEPVDGWLIREFKNGLVWRSLLVQAESFERNPSNVLSTATTLERVKWMERRNAAWCARYGGGW